MKEFLKGLGRRVTGRKGIGNTVTVAIIIAVIMLNILAYTLTNAFGLYFYSPETDDLTISGSTDELFANATLIGKKVTVTFCYAEDKLEKHDTGSFVLNTARQLEERYPELIELRFVSLLTKMDESGRIVDFDKYLDGGKNNLKQSSVIFECGEQSPYQKSPVHLPAKVFPLLLHEAVQTPQHHPFRVLPEWS